MASYKNKGAKFSPRAPTAMPPIARPRLPGMEVTGPVTTPPPLMSLNTQPAGIGIRPEASVCILVAVLPKILNLVELFGCFMGLDDIPHICNKFQQTTSLFPIHTRGLLNFVDEPLSMIWYFYTLSVLIHLHTVWGRLLNKLCVKWLTTLAIPATNHVTLQQYMWSTSSYILKFVGENKGWQLVLSR